MKKKLTLLALATPLLIAGCVTDTGEQPEDDLPPTTSAAPATTEAPEAADFTDPQTLENAEGHPLALITLHSMTTDGCDIRTESPVAEGAKKVRLNATVEVVDDPGESAHFLSPTDLYFVDDAGYKINNNDMKQDDTYPCNSDESTSFIDLQQGDKRRASITMYVPESTAILGYSPSYSLSVPTNYVEWDIFQEVTDLSPNEIAVPVEPPPVAPPSTAAPAPAPAPTPAPNTQAPAPENYYDPPAQVEEQGSIWTNPGEGFNCPATDAYVIDPSYCTAENLGADPAYDELFAPPAATP